jgi:hypothetical protein
VPRDIEPETDGFQAASQSDLLVRQALKRAERVESVMDDAVAAIRNVEAGVTALREQVRNDLYGTASAKGLMHRVGDIETELRDRNGFKRHAIQALITSVIVVIVGFVFTAIVGSRQASRPAPASVERQDR